VPTVCPTWSESPLGTGSAQRRRPIHDASERHQAAHACRRLGRGPFSLFDGSLGPHALRCGPMQLTPTLCGVRRRRALRPPAGAFDRPSTT
jgi:hypothetical protein